MAKNSSVTVNFGGIGAIAAAVMSYMKWHSLGYAILHCLCGWFYVLYYLIAYGNPFKF